MPRGRGTPARGLTQLVLGAGELLVAVEGGAVRPPEPGRLRGQSGGRSISHPPAPPVRAPQREIPGSPSEPGRDRGGGTRVPPAGPEVAAPGGGTHDLAEAALHLHVGLAVVVDVGFAVLAPQAKFVVDWQWEGWKGEGM